jgi:hypothetical protein
LVQRSNRQSGYGFVHFSCDSAGIEAAFQAVAALDNSTIDGITYNVELSKNLLKQFNADGSAKKDAVATEGAGSGNNSGLSSPQRSSYNLLQGNTPMKSPTGGAGSFNELGERIPSSLDILASPFDGNATPIRSNNPNSNKQQIPSVNYPSVVLRSPTAMDPSSLPRSFSNRIPSQSNITYQQQSQQATTHRALGSRENSFRSNHSAGNGGGLRSNNGSFRCLNARSSSAQSLMSSVGNTTVACTTTASSPSPLSCSLSSNNGHLPLSLAIGDDNSPFHKHQSFRSDPGGNRVYSFNKGGQGNGGIGASHLSNTSLLGQGSTHSLSFQESPLSRSLFSTQHSKFGTSEISLLSVPGQAILSSSEYGSFYHSRDNHFDEIPLVPPPRPDSRASDCSDVSTDIDGDEGNDFIVTEEVDGIDALFMRSHPNKEGKRFKKKKSHTNIMLSTNSNNDYLSVAHLNKQEGMVMPPPPPGIIGSSPHHHHQHSYPSQIQQRILSRNNSNSSHLSSGNRTRSNQSMRLSSESLLETTPFFGDLDSLSLNNLHLSSNHQLLSAQQQLLSSSPSASFYQSKNYSLSSPHHSEHNLLQSSQLLSSPPASSSFSALKCSSVSYSSPSLSLNEINSFPASSFGPFSPSSSSVPHLSAIHEEHLMHDSLTSQFPVSSSLF